MSAEAATNQSSFQEDRARQRPPSRASGLRRFGFLGASALFLFGKAKWFFALLKFAKVGPLLSMFGTVWVYSMFFGWPFAAGFVALIFVHEMGHAIALRQQGIPSGAPVFIPFVGAFIAMRGRPRDAFVEAIVGIGGPLLGTLGAALCLVAAYLTGFDLLYALASVGFFLNLFNMIPISPLDGGRIAGAISRGFWVVGYAVGITVFLATYSPILGLILFVGVFTIVQRWRHPVPGYYAISTGKRVAVGAGYFGLLALMVFGMAASDVHLEHLGGQAALGLAAGAHVFGGLLGGSVRDRLAGQTADASPI
jgi:Zn-dependent protease